MAHAGRHTHHVLAAKPHPHHYQHIRTSCRRETRVRNPAESTGMPHPDAQSRRQHRKPPADDSQAAITGQKTTERTPADHGPPSFPTGNQCSPGNFNTPVGGVWIPILQCRWGCFPLIHPVQRQRWLVVEGEKGHRRNPPLFPTNHKLPQAGNFARYVQWVMVP